MKPESKAHAFFLEAIKKHAAFERGLKQIRADAMDAAFMFVQSRELIPHGEWGAYLELHAERIAPRTVRFYINLAEQAIAWAKDDAPRLKTISEVHAHARNMVMQSPKPLVALCRELGFMRKFGEYDAVKYRERRAGLAAQIEFNFDHVFSAVDMLSHLGDENFSIVYADDQDSEQALGQLETKLETALARVRDVRKNGRPIET